MQFLKEQKNFFTQRRLEETVFPELLRKRAKGSLGNGQNQDKYKRVSGQQHAPSSLYPRERPGTNFARGWMVPRAGLDWWKISSPPGFDPGLSSP